MVLAADRGDLFRVMAAMDEMEAAPLVDVKRAQDVMGDGALLSEGGFGLLEELVGCR